MRYYLDTEFNGFGGQLLSLALVREDGESMYWVSSHNCDQHWDGWVLQNVVPLYHECPVEADMATPLPQQIMNLMDGDGEPVIVTDWPDDIRYFCQAIITGPGQMIPLPDGLEFELRRVDAYPTTLPGAVQHNAWWDAMALRHMLIGAPHDQR
ncbi:MAG TPA: hypothetical protein VKQ27_08755 [Acetobacteraceae bacterium]|nr:hypothetical protein [Acetobacteraceae bacterium]